MDAVRLVVPKLRDGFRWEAKFERRAFKFLPITESLPQSEWHVVKTYLEQVGEATSTELHERLRAEGFVMTENALQKKVKRWERRGCVVIRKNTFPPRAYVSLPTYNPVNAENAHFGQSSPPTVQIGEIGSETQFSHFSHFRHFSHSGHTTLQGVQIGGHDPAPEPPEPSRGDPSPEPAPASAPSRRPTCPQCGGVYVRRESGGRLWCYTCRSHYLLDGAAG